MFTDTCWQQHLPDLCQDIVLADDSVNVQQATRKKPKKKLNAPIQVIVSMLWCSDNKFPTNWKQCVLLNEPRYTYVGLINEEMWG